MKEKCRRWKTYREGSMRDKEKTEKD
jgi:hypothetical protein